MNDISTEDPLLALAADPQVDAGTSRDQLPLLRCSPSSDAWTPGDGELAFECAADACLRPAPG